VKCRIRNSTAVCMMCALGLSTAAADRFGAIIRNVGFSRLVDHVPISACRILEAFKTSHGTSCSDQIRHKSEVFCLEFLGHWSERHDQTAPS
jgi:hypothetical protein